MSNFTPMCHKVFVHNTIHIAYISYNTDYYDHNVTKDSMYGHILEDNHSVILLF